MTLFEYLGYAAFFGMAITMAIIVFGPFYLLFVVLPEATAEARKQKFIQMRRDARKKRARNRRYDSIVKQ